MKISTIAIASCLIVSNAISAQVKAPKLSPVSKLEQTVGLTDIVIEYSRPSKSNREVFPDVVPMNEVWRTGANKNTTIKTSDFLLFGKDTLKAGTYAIFTKPTADSWSIYFYKETENWGTPDKWDEKMIALTLTAPVKKMNDVTETFEISIENITIDGATIAMKWDKTRVAADFKLATKSTVLASIEKTMAGPSASDYNDAASFYYREKKDMKQALVWINKAVEMKPDAFWMQRQKSLIQAELGDKKGAIATAKISMASAEKEGYANYVEMNKKSIAEWSK